MTEADKHLTAVAVCLNGYGHAPKDPMWALKPDGVDVVHRVKALCDELNQLRRERDQARQILERLAAIHGVYGYGQEMDMAVDAEQIAHAAIDLLSGWSSPDPNVKAVYTKPRGEA